MIHHKKTLWASLGAFFVGTSCCWLSSLVIWLGGASLIGSAITFIEDIQMLLLSLGGILALVSLYLYLKRN